MPRSVTISSILDALASGGDINAAADDGATDGAGSGGSSGGRSSGVGGAGAGGVGNQSGSAGSGAGAGAGSTMTASTGDGAGAGANGSAHGSNGSNSSGGSSSSAGSGGDESKLPKFPDGGPLGKPTDSDMSACAKLQGVPVTKIVVLGAQNSAAVAEGSVLAFKVTGNHSRLVLDTGDDEHKSLAGICLFLAGNEAKADVHVGRKVDRVVYVGGGNHSHANFVFDGHGRLGHLAASLGGNQAELHMTGVGSRSGSGDTVSQKGHDTVFSSH